MHLPFIMESYSAQPIPPFHPAGAKYRQGGGELPCSINERTAKQQTQCSLAVSERQQMDVTAEYIEIVMPARANQALSHLARRQNRT